jgi:hypothetical protein
MRIQKIRGHNRRYKHIKDWISKNKELRSDLIDQYKSDHIDIVVHPWCDISIINSKIPEPKGKTRLEILKGLIDIYDALKTQMDQLGKPYYLKIWIFVPRFSKSQVVCAIDDKINYYNNTFDKPIEKKDFKPNDYGFLNKRLKDFSWDYVFDEDFFDNDFVSDSKLYYSIEEYNYANRWFTKQMKKPHRTIKYDEPIGNIIETYAFKRGYIWIGEK